MRRADESKTWQQLINSRRNVPPRTLLSGTPMAMDLQAPCTVVGGRNGAGKTRLLRSLHAELGPRAVFINLHYLCEHALAILRSRRDVEDLAEEVGILDLSADRLDDVRRVVSRDYDHVAWYALELEPSDPEVALRFRWRGDDQTLVPYFKVSYRGVGYTAEDMGQGEFSVHFLFWILEQYRDQEDVVLLLDEPDAFLPPVGVSALLNRLLAVCLRRNWTVVLSTHSEELISLARENEAFALVRIDQAGVGEVVHCATNPGAGTALLARPSIDLVLFTEDEAAFHMAAALLRARHHRISRTTTIIWGNGEGGLRKLREHLPRPRQPEISFAVVFDGDQRSQVAPSTQSQWPALFLPSDQDPDALLRELRVDVDGLAAKLGVDALGLAELLESLEGGERHDWVDDVAERYGRSHTLSAMADLWVERNPDLAAEFDAQLGQHL